MTRYLLQARCLVGPLSNPTRNETRTQAGDDLAALEQLAQSLAADGFTVWLLENDPARRPGPGTPGWSRRATYTPADPTRAQTEDEASASAMALARRGSSSSLKRSRRSP